MSFPGVFIFPCVDSVVDEALILFSASLASPIFFHFFYMCNHVLVGTCFRGTLSYCGVLHIEDNDWQVFSFGPRRICWKKCNRMVVPVPRRGEVFIFACVVSLLFFLRALERSSLSRPDVSKSIFFWFSCGWVEKIYRNYWLWSMMNYHVLFREGSYWVTYHWGHLSRSSKKVTCFQFFPRLQPHSWCIIFKQRKRKRIIQSIHLWCFIPPRKTWY